MPLYKTNGVNGGLSFNLYIKCKHAWIVHNMDYGHLDLPDIMPKSGNYIYMANPLWPCIV